MIKYAFFGGNVGEFNNWLSDNNIDPSEAKYINRETDVNGLRDVEIIMYGTYYERGQGYTELADRLERLQNGERENGSRIDGGFATGRAEEDKDPGEPGKDDLPAVDDSGQGHEQSDPDEPNPSTVKGLNLPRRKSNEAKAKANGSAGLVEPVVEGGIRYWQDGDQWCAAHDATFVDIQESKIGFGKTKVAALEAFQAEAAK